MPELTLSKSVVLTDLATSINRYRQFTPGSFECLHVRVLLEDGTRFVPGMVAMVNHGWLRQSEADEHGIVGPPNFVLDVFGAGEQGEYETRRDAFGRAGVTEYVDVVLETETYCHWNRHDGAGFDLIQPDGNGVIKSKALPGLWFPTHYEQGREHWTLLDRIENGVTRLGHHEFMETIWHKNGRDPEWEDRMPFDTG